MKLSIAMMLGEAMMPRNNGTSWTGSKAPHFDDCGCALGRAWFACGKTAAQLAHDKSHFSLWPWLRISEETGGPNYRGEISVMFNAVLSGQQTFEQLVDWVASVEPDCGECNRFECACVKTKSHEAVEVLQENQ